MKKMTKMFNTFSVVGGAVGGLIVSLFGGWDVMLHTILLFFILDYITGIIKAIYKKELSSEIGFKGIAKKIMIFIVIAVAYSIQNMTGDTIALREIVIVFFICNEALSILENAAEFIAVPQQLKDVLLQLRDKNADTAENKDESED
jgi:toxin secretion/phage lysis holin